MANGDADSNLPLSWRDVYRAVGDSETRVVAAINSAVAPLNSTAIDHEARLRAIETQGSPEAREALAMVRAVDIRVTAIKEAASLRTGKEAGVFATLGAGKSFVLLAVAVSGSVLAMFDLISRIATR